jgi:hypothetical protein
MTHWRTWFILLFSCERALLRDVRRASRQLLLVRPDGRGRDEDFSSPRTNPVLGTTLPARTSRERFHVQTLIGSLGLLQPTKGAIVALQWQAGMHGFAASKQRRLADSEVRVQAATRAVPPTGRS